MSFLDELFANNRAWARDITSRDPEFFRKLSRQQAPEYLWIGCADSRVPANEIVGLLPGELFVHRNVANVVSHTDLSCLSVLQYAVEVLKVKHIIVCGHYGCGGVKAAMEDKSLGLIDNWLRSIRGLYERNRETLAELDSEVARVDRMCELNVMAQVVNVAKTTVVEGAWARGQELTVHGWIYGIKDGMLRELGVSVGGIDEVPALD